MNQVNIDKTIKLLGVRINNIDVYEVIRYISETINKKNKAIISNVNIHALNICYENEWFSEFINESEIVFCDGIGVRIGAALTGQRLDYRFTPPDWIDLLCSFAVKNNWKMFFLGAKPGIARLAANNLIKSHPGLIIHNYHGFFDHFGKENEKIIDMINEANSDVILVGMGMPLQEKWIKENYDRINSPAVFLPVGALFDYVSETVQRGPQWLTNNGFEWLSRLFIEPKRLWRRYLIGNPKFFFRLITQKKN